MEQKNDSLPEPETGKAGGGRAIFWACLAVLILGCAGWWISRENEERERWRETAANFVNDALRGTPLAGLGDVVRSTPPPPPDRVLNPPTEAGTLAGRVVEGTVGSPADLSVDDETPSRGAPLLSLTTEGAHSGETEAPRSPQFSNVPLPPAQEDSQLKPDYLADLSRWLVARYKPGPRGGTLGISVQSLNNLVGVTIAQRARGGRSALLRYAMQPSMIQGLYRLYINKFMEDLDAAAAKRGLSKEENSQFHLALGGGAALMATALEGVLAVPELGAKINKIEELAQNAADLTASLAEAIAELDESRSAKAGPQRLNALQMRVDGITARYRRAMDEHRQARLKLIDDIRSRSGQSLDDDGLLFVAYWAQRRVDDDPDAPESLKGCANVMRDLARRCAQAAQSS
ncbi:MAG: hypothetical protein K2H64_06010 [Desulfovibrio sp.]|nr:hypothetical protein [Desulfovibrio sp.]